MSSYGFFFFKQKTAYEMLRSLVGSEMCIRDSLASVPCRTALGMMSERFSVQALNDLSMEAATEALSEAEREVQAMRQHRARQANANSARSAPRTIFWPPVPWQVGSIAGSLDEKAIAETDRILEAAGHEEGKWELVAEPREDIATYVSTSNPYLTKGCFRLHGIPAGVALEVLADMERLPRWDPQVGHARVLERISKVQDVVYYASPGSGEQVPRDFCQRRTVLQRVKLRDRPADMLHLIVMEDSEHPSAPSSQGATVRACVSLSGIILQEDDAIPGSTLVTRVTQNDLGGGYHCPAEIARGMADLSREWYDAYSRECGVHLDRCMSNNLEAAVVPPFASLHTEMSAMERDGVMRVISRFDRHPTRLVIRGVWLLMNRVHFDRVFGLAVCGLVRDFGSLEVIYGHSGAKDEAWELVANGLEELPGWVHDGVSRVFVSEMKFLTRTKVKLTAALGPIGDKLTFVDTTEELQEHTGLEASQISFLVRGFKHPAEHGAAAGEAMDRDATAAMGEHKDEEGMRTAGYRRSQTAGVPRYKPTPTALDAKSGGDLSNQAALDKLDVLLSGEEDEFTVMRCVAHWEVVSLHSHIDCWRRGIRHKSAFCMVGHGSAR
eukprot:TRINITY_DN14496_c0_g1_i1.p1 TRINITY_DN14496_c0_g1~~TRINITY_DN14496_c0_g1_i1.p1  ORF type:complete len:610 (+),score=133.65 TRINITY_DN14496_c0_g1_i1:50-1879(+)